MKVKNDGGLIATNKKAYHDYFIEETYEAGIVLEGSEVKSLRQHNVSFVDSYVRIDGYNVFVVNLHISPYEKGSYYNPPAKRERRLLLNKREINKLRAMVERKGYTLVPTKLYFKQALVKRWAEPRANTPTTSARICAKRPLKRTIAVTRTRKKTTKQTAT